MELSGKHAFVTGGATGIGEAITRALIGAGARVTIASRNIDRLDELATSLDGVKATALDITDAEAVDTVISAADPIDILINNAGAAYTAPLQKTSAENWAAMLDVNLTGTFLCTQAALKGMLARGEGRIINIASIAGLKGFAYASAYAAAKHGVIGMTKSLALELAETNITANCVCPGFTDTAMVSDAVENITSKTGRSADEALAALVKNNPQKRLIFPEEVASTVLWLTKSESRSVTGQSIVVAGGEVM